MNVLWNPQISNPDNIYADSNIQFFLGIALELRNINFGLILPEIEGWKALDNVHFLGEPRYKMKNRSRKLSMWKQRVNWDWDQMSGYFRRDHFGVDVIWENNPTLIYNWRLLHDIQGTVCPPIVGYNHWIDSKEFPKTRTEHGSLELRQVEGVARSDVFMVNSQEAINQMSAMLGRYKLRQHNDKLVAIPPIVNTIEYPNSDLTSLRQRGKFRILYNHRVGSTLYYTDAFHHFCGFMNEVSKSLAPVEMDRIVVTFTDPSGKLGDASEIPIQNIPVEIARRKDRMSYETLLRSSNLQVSTFQPDYGGCWSMSIADAINAQVSVLFRKHSGYAEMVPDDFPWAIGEGESMLEPFLRLFRDDKERERNTKLAYHHYKTHFGPGVVGKDISIILNRLTTSGTYIGVSE